MLWRTPDAGRRDSGNPAAPTPPPSPNPTTPAWPQAPLSRPPPNARRHVQSGGDPKPAPAAAADFSHSNSAIRSTSADSSAWGVDDHQTIRTHVRVVQGCGRHAVSAFSQTRIRTALDATSGQSSKNHQVVPPGEGIAVRIGSRPLSTTSNAPLVPIPRQVDPARRGTLFGGWGNGWSCGISSRTAGGAAWSTMTSSPPHTTALAAFAQRLGPLQPNGGVQELRGG